MFRSCEQVMARKKHARSESKAKGAFKKSGRATAANVKPVRGLDGLLPAQRRFCREYVLDWNGTQAAIRAGYSPRTARSQAHDLLTKPDIRAEIGRLEREAAEKLEIDHHDILRRLWGIATGDVNDLVRIERRACRYCHGIDHEFQWKTEREYREACDRFAQKLAGGDQDRLIALGEAIDVGTRIPGMPDDAGGFGFDATAAPAPECPECFGEGIATVQLSDSREAVSHPLYAGVKQTKDGIEVKIADRLKALEQVARHLSFVKDAMKIDPSDDLVRAARAINAASPPLTPSYMRDNAARLIEDDEGTPDIAATADR